MSGPGQETRGVIDPKSKLLLSLPQAANKSVPTISTADTVRPSPPSTSPSPKRPATESPSGRPSKVVKLKIPTKMTSSPMQSSGPLVLTDNTGATEQRTVQEETSTRTPNSSVLKVKVPARSSDTFIKSLANSYTQERSEQTAMMQELEELKKEKASWALATSNEALLRHHNRKLKVRSTKQQAEIQSLRQAVRDYAKTAAACKPIIVGTIEKRLVKEGLEGAVATLEALREYEKHFCAAEIEIPAGEAEAKTGVDA